MSVFEMSGLGYASRSPEESDVAQSGEDGGEANTPATARKLIQNAQLHLEVDSCDDARRAIEAELAKVGGYLSSADISHHEGRVSRATLVLRIPASTLTSSVATFSALGTVVHESLTTQDITEEYFDLESRLTNARKLETRLNELLATEAKELKDLLEVERELARVRETIERFEGKLRLWEKQVAFSTLTVSLATHATYVATEAPGLGPQIRETLATSWHALVTFGRAIVIGVVAILPWLVPVFVVVFVLRLLVRRRRRSKPPGDRNTEGNPPPSPA